MITRITSLKNNSDMTRESFQEYWAEVHAPKCFELPYLYGYEQNYVTMKEKGDASSEDVISDGFSIERYETLYEYEQAIKSSQYKDVLEDRKVFSAYSETYVCLENTAIPLAREGAYGKRISLCGRSVPLVSFEDFTREWVVVHSVCMMKMPAEVFYGYHQHLIIDRLIGDEHVSHSTLPVDGVLELYFSDPKAVSDAFATTPEGRETVAHRKEFMSSVNPFQVTYRRFK